MGEVVEGLNGRVNLSGSSRGVEEKASGLPPVRVLFPAPFAPVMGEIRGRHRAAAGEVEFGLGRVVRVVSSSRRRRSSASFARAPSASRRANSSKSLFIFVF